MTRAAMIYAAANVVELLVIWFFVRRTFGRMFRGW